MSDARTILYIEDEEDYQILAKRILGRAGLHVVTADSGAEGLEQLRRKRPDLLILDINLPDTDGYTICSQLRQDPAFVDLPILMLTVRRRPEEWLRGFASGANDYISKPLNPPELLERVLSCLEGRSVEQTDPSSPEYQLVQAAAAGNKKAFEVLIEQFRSKLLDSMKSLGHTGTSAEDIVSAAFSSAYENIHQFRGEAAFFTWLYRIALSAAKDHYQRRQDVSLEAWSQGDESSLPAELAQADRVQEAFSQNEMNQKAHEALRLVPTIYRDILELYFMEDLSYQQIAQKLKIPQGTVMSRLHKGRQLLQEAWKKREALTHLQIARQPQ